MALMPRLRELMADGVSPEVAAKTALEELRDDVDTLIEDVTPMVERAARDIERSMERFTRQTAMSQTPVPVGPHNRGRFPNAPADGEDLRDAARLAMPKMVYRLPDGKRVLWDDWTWDMIQVKLARMRTMTGSFVDHLAALAAAGDLLVEHGGGPGSSVRLRDVPGWVDEVASRAGAARAEVLRDLGATARKPVARKNARHVVPVKAAGSKKANAGRNRSR